MTQPVRAAFARLVTLCALILLPAALQAQLKCLSPSDQEIRSVTFEGNGRFTSDELKLRVLAEPTDKVRRWVRWIFGTRRCYRSGLLPSDSIRLTNFYRDQGFPAAIVRDTLIAVDNHWVDIVFFIREGQPTIVDSSSLVPLDFAVSKLGADLPGLLRLQPGKRYSQALAQADIDTIETRLRNSGYREGHACVFADAVADTAKVFADCRPPVAKGLHIKVRTKIEPGSLWHIRQIIITDTAITGRSAVVADRAVRNLLPFRPGDVYHEQLLTQAQRQLYQLGSFYHAAVEQTAPNDADSSVAIKVLVVEEYMRQLSWLKGWGTQDCFQTGLQYTDKAFNHDINQFEASAQVSKLGWAPPTDWRGVKELCRGYLADDQIASTKVNYSTTLRFTQPAFGGFLNRSLALYSERRGATKAYLRTTFIGGNASLSRLLAEHLDPNGYKQSVLGQFGINGEYGHTDAPDAVSCFLFRACDSTSRNQLQKDKPLSVVNALVTRDWRDNAVIPTSGTLTRVEGRLSSKLLGSASNVQFLKGTADFTWYHPAFRSDVLAVRFRGGWIGGGSSTPGAQFVPPQERLYTGGETSVRGFGTNDLGSLIYVVDDTTTALDSAKIVQRIPTGGNAMLVWNFEYRIRGPFFNNRLQTILFADAGQLWTPSPDALPHPYKWTPGVAFRLFTPIGPVQFNVAYNGNPDPPGPVFFDPGISKTSTGDLICLTGVSASTKECLPTFAPHQPAATWKNPFSRLKFSIAFPPDY